MVLLRFCACGTFKLLTAYQALDPGGGARERDVKVRGFLQPTRASYSGYSIHN